jgi:hypothetical protein
MKVYIVGSLRNKRIPDFAGKLRSAGIADVFDDWYAAGPEADDHWQAYEKGRGHSFAEALAGRAAENVFHFDRDNLNTADAVVLVGPAGKSAHLEAGYASGRGIPVYALLDQDPERFDVMYRFFDGVFLQEQPLVAALLDLQDDVDQRGF